MKPKSNRPLTPKLRFPEFRDNEGWQTPQLSDLYGFKRTNTLSRDKLNYEAGTIRNIHYGDIHTKFRPLFRLEHEDVPFINPEVSVDAFEEKDDCEEGDIVLADASEDLNDVGKAIEVISLDGQRVVAGTHTIVATRYGSIPIVGFGGHLFQSAAVRARVQSESQGAKVYGISANRISSVALPLPPTITEQQKIADCLGSLDALIATEGRKLAALRDHKRGLMQQLFPQPGETQPRLRFPEFQDKGEWVEEELSKCLKTVIDYRGKAPPKSESGVPLITAKNVRFGWLDMTNDEYIEEEKYGEWMSRGIPQLGDILFTTEAPLGNAALFPPSGKFALGQRLLTLRTKSERCVPAFLFHSLLGPTMQEEIDFHSTGSTAKGIKSRVFVKLSFCHSGVQEQHRIADCFTSLDAQITAQTAKIDALKQHKRGLMQQLFPEPEEEAE